MLHIKLKRSGWPNVYIEGSQVIISPHMYFFLVSENNVEPDEIPHYVAFHMGLHCLPKYPFRGFRFSKINLEILTYDPLICTMNRRLFTGIIHQYTNAIINKKTLSYDVASGSEITPCNKICKPLVVYRFSGNVMTSITTFRTKCQNCNVFTPEMKFQSIRHMINGI